MMPKPPRRPEQPQYHAFLLRLWQDDSDGRLVWRASLEDPHTGEKQGFADLSLLYAFLAEQITSNPQEPTAPI